MQNHPIYINLFGTGIRFWLCEIETSVYEKMLHYQQRDNNHWENLFFDFDFLAHFGYKHWSEFSSEKEQVGLLLDPINKIEIKQAQRIISRFKASELTGIDTLFQLHETKMNTLTLSPNKGYKQFTLVQFEKGLIGKFKLQTDSFQVEDLKYELLQLDSFQLLFNIDYQGNLLRKTKDDSVFISSRVIWF